MIALHLRSKRKPLKLDQGSSLEQSEEICDSESPVAVGVFKRGNRGSEIEVITPQNVITEMVGDRVARARASRTEEELFAATACTFHSSSFSFRGSYVLQHCVLHKYMELFYSIPVQFALTSRSGFSLIKIPVLFLKSKEIQDAKLLESLLVMFVFPCS